MSGHLKHLGNGFSCNYLSPDDGLPPTLTVSANSLTGDPNSSTVADNSRISWNFSINVGGIPQTGLVATVTANNVNLIGPEIGMDFTKLIRIVGGTWGIVYNGISAGVATWTLTHSGTAAVGAYTVDLTAGDGHEIRVGESTFVVSDDEGEAISASIGATSTEVGNSTPSSAAFGATIGPQADLDFAITSIGSSPINTNTTQTWSVVTDAKNINTHNNLSVTVSVWWDLPGTRPATAPTNVSITGWTMSTAWNSFNSGNDEYWQAVFTRATQNTGTSTMSYSVNSGSTAGTMKFYAEGYSTEVQTIQNSGITSVTITGYSIDATSGKAVPANATEWSNFLTEKGLTGITAPDFLYLLQESSGNVADTIGGIGTLDANNSPTYQQTISGWSRKAVKTTDGTLSKGFYKASPTSLPDPATTSYTLVTFAIIDATPAATRTLFKTTDGSAQVRITATPRIQVYSGSGENKIGSASPTGQVRPFWEMIDITNNNTMGGSDAEKLHPIHVDPTSKGFALGGFDAAAVAGGYLYAFGWTGTDAQINSSNMRKLLNAMGWTVGWPTWGQTLTKTGGVSGNYDAQAYTNETFSGTVSVEFRIETGSHAFVVGLSADNPDANYTGIDFGLLDDAGTMFKCENGTLTSLGATVSGDYWRVTRTMSSGAVTYYKNGSLVDTSGNTGTGAMRVDSSFRFANNRADDVRVITGSSSEEAITWTTSGVTVT